MIIRAVIIVVCLVGGAGAITRAAHRPAVALQADLDQLPMSIDGWNGRPGLPFDERTIKVLGADEYINRLYHRGTAGSSVSLFVGFYGNQASGDTMHSPLNCMPGSGWEPVSRARRALSVSDQRGVSRAIEVNELVVQQGNNRHLVLYWYQSRGRVTASEYRSKVLTVTDAIRFNRTDGALIRVIAPITTDMNSARAQALQFAGSMFPALAARLPS